MALVAQRNGDARPTDDGRAIDSLFAQVATELGRPNTMVAVAYDSLLGCPRTFDETRAQMSDADVYVRIDSLQAIP